MWNLTPRLPQQHYPGKLQRILVCHSLQNFSLREREIEIENERESERVRARGRAGERERMNKDV